MYDDYKKVIAANLRALRARDNLIQREVPPRLNVSPSAYSNWEQATRAPTIPAACQIADLFDVSTDWLFGRTGGANSPAGQLDFVAIDQKAISVDSAIIQLSASHDTAALQRQYVESRGLTENKIIAQKAIDDSMAGDIQEGDEVLIDRTVTQVTRLDMFAILSQQKTVWIRWIRPELADNTYTMYCNNSALYPNQTLTADELKALKIIGRITRISRDR